MLCFLPTDALIYLDMHSQNKYTDCYLNILFNGIVILLYSAQQKNVIVD